MRCSEKVDRYGGSGLTAHGLQHRLDQADRLARAVNLDMAEVGWRPTVDNYLGRVTKTRILEAVREAKGEGAMQLIGHLKKSEMAEERPSVCSRTPVGSPSRCGSPKWRRRRTSNEALPEFLSDDEGQAGEVGESEPRTGRRCQIAHRCRRQTPLRSLRHVLSSLLA